MTYIVENRYLIVQLYPVLIRDPAYVFYWRGELHHIEEELEPVIHVELLVVVEQG